MPMNPRLLRPTAPGGFDPRRLAGLAAWFDTTDSTKRTIDTGVTTWVDKSANAYTLTQGTGTAQPTLSTLNGVQAFAYNGAAAQHLAGTDSGLVALGTSGSNAVPNLTVFYVASFSSIADVRPVCWGRSTTVNPFLCMTHPISSPIEAWRPTYRTDANVQASGNSAAGLIASNTAYVVGTTLSSAGFIGRANGSQVVSASLPTGDTQITSDRFAVGGLLRTNFALAVTGTIGDVVIFNRVLSASEISTVERWLGRKFGITVA